MNEQQLLTQITAISQNYDLLNKKTGGYFNIFDIADISNDEVIICRVLCEILSQTGSHHQGDTYLRLFFENVLRINICDEELETVRVHREYLINDNRRIDLVIETATKFIPIEVKIYAGEQKNQCYDYYMEAKKHQSDPVLYYLTRFGYSPSEYSANGLTENDDGYDEIVSISFADDILNWLDCCLKETVTIKIAPIREIILQFMSTIRGFTGKMEDEKEMEVIELITSSSKNMKSAMDIQSALVKAKIEMLDNLFKTIEQKVGRKRLQNNYDYAEKISTFYSRQRTNSPGISFLYKANICPNKKENIDVDVRIEIGHDIYIGYYCPKNGEAKGQLLSPDELKQLLGSKKLNDGYWCDEHWWPYYEMCLIDSEESPNFKDFNDAYFALYDKNNFDKFTTYCADRILLLLNS